MISGTWCDFWGCSVQSWELDVIILVDPFQLGILHDSVMFKCLKIVLGCFTSSCCDHIKFRNLLRAAIFLMLVFSEANFFSLRQLAIFTAFVFHIDSVLQKAESLGIKQPAWCVQIVCCVCSDSLFVCSNSLLDFVIYNLVPQTTDVLSLTRSCFISLEKIAREIFFFY